MLIERRKFEILKNKKLNPEKFEKENIVVKLQDSES